MGYAEPLGQPSRRCVEKEAIGVVACITPWNVPLQINLAKCVPALATGYRLYRDSQGRTGYTLVGPYTRQVG
jgi:acyl-CoA reductase-like NAD-dependent aldehyde dehydrogenase